MKFVKIKHRFITPIGLGLILLILITSHTHAQSNIRLSGQVLDADTGFPLSNVAVQVEETAYGAYTNQDGFFYLENISPSVYSIQFSSLGYETQTIANVEIIKDVSKRLFVHLNPQPLQADSIEVLSEYAADESGLEGEKTILSGTKLDRYRQLGLQQILQQVAGLQVEAIGTGGTRSIISIHGGRSSQVLVLLDGQRLNNPQTGEVDLSEIPLQQIESIEIIRQGNSALFGGSAFDGVISFHSRQSPRTNQYSLLSRAGSFSSFMGSISSGLSVWGIGGLFNYQQDYSRQDFAYKYQGETFTRENAWNRNRKFFGKVSFNLPLGEENSRYHLNLLYNRREGNRGLPCSFFNECEDLSSKMEENVQALQIQQRWIFSSKGYLEGLIAHHRLYQLFDNANDVIRINRYRTEQTNQTFETKVVTKFAAGNLSDIRIGVQYLNEALDQKNLLNPQSSIGEKSRESKAGFGGLEIKIPALNPVLQRSKIFSSIRYEKYFNQIGRWYPTVGASFVPSFWKAMNLSMSWYKAVRYPDFNSLFWAGDTRARGNPDLLPERKTAWNASLRIRQNQRFFPELGLHFYSEQIEDLIYWYRTFNGIWEPRNEDRAKKEGIDVELRQDIIQDHIQFQSAYGFVNAVNKVEEPNRFDKRIIFIPRNTLNSSIAIGWSRWQVQIVYRYVSERETVVANSQGTQLNAYGIWDVSCSYQHPIGSLKINFGLALKNISDTDYQLIYGYPMPGREFEFSVSLDFQTK